MPILEFIIIIIVIMLVFICIRREFKLKGGFLTNYKPQNEDHAKELRLNPTQLIDEITDFWKETDRIRFNLFYSAPMKNIKLKQANETFLNRYTYERNKPKTDDFITYRVHHLVHVMLDEHDRIMSKVPRNMWNNTTLNPTAFDGALAEAMVAFFIEKKALLHLIYLFLYTNR